MPDRAALAHALAAALPPAQQPHAAALADAILAALSDPTRSGQLASYTSALHTLVGQQVATGNEVLSFGQGNDQRGATITVGDVAGGNIVTDNAITIEIALPPAAPPDANRAAMLTKVRLAWIEGVLHHAFDQPPIALRLTERPDAVQQPYEQIEGRSDQNEELLPEGTSLLDVYDQQGGALLLLGAPGAGKTTLLLQLAEQLLARANAEVNLPMPVVFNLASWSVGQLPLAEWLMLELNRQYSVPQKVARGWVENNHVLPLLDGLDEVDEPARAACATAINSYRQEQAGLLPMVVCCRLDEYAALPQLHLHSAVVIQPLDKTQLMAHLASGGEALASIRTALERDPTLWELLDTPLLISVMTAAFTDQGLSAALAHASPDEQRRALFAAYVDRMLDRKADNRRYPRAMLLRWLGWLARQLRRTHQSTYQIEQMQPDWLQGTAQAVAYRALIVLVAGSIAGLIFAIISLQSDDIGFRLLISIGGGLIFGLIASLSSTITPIDRLVWSWDAINLRWPVVLAVLGGLLIGVITSINLGITSGLILGLIVGINLGLGGILINGLRSSPRLARDAPNHAMKRSLVSGLVGGLGLGVIFTFVFGVGVGYWSDWFTGLRFGLFSSLVGLVVGGLVEGWLAVIRHYALRLVLWASGTFPLAIAPFLDHCVERLLLRRVGGGWIIAHRLLLDYLADTDYTNKSS